MSALPSTVRGVDPGPTPGVVVLRLDSARRLCWVGVAQVSANLLRFIVDELRIPGDLLAVERFVVKGPATADQRLTRDQTAWLEARETNRVVLRSASEVKPWATDERLDRAGLLAATKGMRHARDAARHALFAAVHDAGLTDPLSREWKGAVR